MREMRTIRDRDERQEKGECKRKRVRKGKTRSQMRVDERKRNQKKQVRVDVSGRLWKGKDLAPASLLPAPAWLPLGQRTTTLLVLTIVDREL